MVSGLAKGTTASIHHFFSAMVMALIMVFTISSAASGQTIAVEIKTEILPPDYQAGIKSTQSIEVDFDSRTIVCGFETGTTKFCIDGIGFELDSVRNDFGISNISFEGDVARFTATGQTASGVGVLPNINYHFEFTISKDGQASIAGCHDGYPAYTVMVGGTPRYTYMHPPGEVGRLLGECDVWTAEDWVNDEAPLSIESSAIQPDGAGSGAIVFEASSRHAAIQLTYENPLANRTEWVIYAIAPDETRQASAWSVLRRGFAQTIGGMGTPGRTGAALVNRQFALQLQQTDLPPADFRFLVRADSAIVASVDALLNLQMPSISAELDTGNYLEIGRAMAGMFRSAVLAGPQRALEVQVNSAGDRIAPPPLAEGTTALSWLFAYALQGESSSTMAGCGQTTGDDERQLLTALQDGLDHPIWTSYWILEWFGDKLDRANLGLPLPEPFLLLKSSLQADRYAEFMLLGHLDPARLDVVACKAHRRLRGLEDPVALVIDRSEIYRVVSEEIARTRGEEAPMFFDAARAVTRLVGVGMVDLASDQRLNNESAIVSLSGKLLGLPSCLKDVEELLPDPIDRIFLRSVNEELLEFNTPRMRRLIEAPSLWFDPVTMGALAPPEDIDPSLWFDLRMVQAEQDYVEGLIRNAGIEPGSDRDLALTRAEVAMRCLSVSRFIAFIEAAGPTSNHLELIRDVDTALDRLETEGILRSDQRQFTNRDWRIAVGSAFVFALHGRALPDADSWVEDFVRHIRLLRRAPQAYLPGVPRALQDRINGAIEAAGNRWSNDRIEAVIEATQLYLGDTVDSGLYRCGETIGGLATTVPYPILASPRERIARLSEVGIGAIALPVELASQGGALSPSLLSSPVNDSETFCAALEARHHALACAVAAQKPTGDCSLGALRLADREDGAARFLFMEPTIRLREDLSHLAPFLLRELRGLGNNPTSAEVDRAVRDAVRSEVDFSLALALAALMAEQTPEVRSALSVTDADANWIDLLERARPPETGQIVRGVELDVAAAAELDKALSLDSQVTRLADVERDLLREVRPLQEPAAFVPVRTTATGSDPLSSNVGNTPNFLTAVTLAPGGTGLGFEMDELGPDEDGAMLYTASLVFRRATTGATASATCEDCTLASSATLPDPSGRLPLGIDIGPVAVAPDGAITLRGSVGEPLVRYHPEQTRAALYALGMPRAIALGGISLDFDATLEDVQLDADLGMAGLTGLVVRIPVIVAGEMVDFEAVAQTAIETAAAQWLSASAGDLSFDISLSNSDDIPIRLRLEPGSLQPRIDWSGGAVTASATMALLVGDGEAIQQFDASTVLVVSRDGVEIQSLSFAAADPDRLAKAIMTIPPFNALAAFADKLTVLPEFTDGKFTLLARAVVNVDGCETTLEQRIDPTDIGDDLEEMSDALAKSGSELATCALSRSLGANLARLTGGQVELFGVIVAFDFESMRQGEDMVTGQVTVPVSFPDAQFDGCDAAIRAKVQSIDNLIFDLRPDTDSFGISLSELTGNDRASLGAALHCRLAADLQAISGTMRVTNMEVGHNMIAADVTLSNLPFFGDLALPRIDLLNLDLNVGDIFRAALNDQANKELVQLAAELVGDELDLAGVGTFRPDWNTARFDLFEGREIVLQGDLSISQDLSFRVNLVLPLERDTLSGFRIEAEGGAVEAVVNNLVGMLVTMLPFPEGPKIINPRFMRLDDAGYRWGLVFGAEAQFSVGEYGVDVVIRRVAISADGVDLDQQIRMGLDIAMVLGPVTLSKILVIYNTGADGGSKGLTLGADMTMLAPMVANILKIEALLDLRDADVPRFVLDGDLIAFGSLALLETSGVIDLKEQLVTFDAATTDAIRDVIDAAANGEINGGEKLVRASTEIAVLGVDLQRALMEFCTSACNELYPGGGSMRLSVADDLPFGPSSRIDFRSDLELRDPSLGAGVALDLFGWKPGGAGMSADLRRVRVDLSFLGLEVGITTPTIELMSPEYIASVLMSLLDIDLEALLRLPPSRIEISLMQGDGSTSTAAGGDGESDDNGEEAAQALPGDRTPIPPGRAEAPPSSPPPTTRDAGVEENVTGPSQPIWGETVSAIFCEEVGSPSPGASTADHPARSIDSGDRYQLWPLWPGSKENQESPLFSGHPHTLPNFHTPTFSAAMASSICIRSGNRLILRTLTQDNSSQLSNVGVARLPSVSSHTCEDSVPAFDYYRLDPNDPSRLADYSNAQRSVLCFETSTGRFDVEARLLWRETEKDFLAVLFCPSVDEATDAELQNQPGYLAACSPDAGPIVLAPTETCDSGCSRISDVEERNLIDGQLRPILLHGRSEFHVDRILDETVLEYGGAAVQMRQIEVSGPDGQVSWQRFELAIETDSPGVSRIVDLKLKRPPDGMTGLWLWMQPNHPGIRNALLLRWLESGRQPTFVAGFPEDGWLVIRSESFASLEPRGLQEWFQDFGTEPPRVVELDAPWAPPSDGKDAAAKRTDAWMKGLQRLMPVLLPRGNNWRLDVGVAPQSGIAVYAFTPRQPVEQVVDLILHLHAYDGDLGSPWLGGAAEPARTHCTTQAAVIDALAAIVAPDRSTRVSIEALVANPDELTVDSGLSRHAFAVIREMEPCN